MYIYVYIYTVAAAISALLKVNLSFAKSPPLAPNPKNKDLTGWLNAEMSHACSFVYNGIILM